MNVFEKQDNSFQRSHSDNSETFLIAVLRFIDGFTGCYLYILMAGMKDPVPPYVNQTGFVIFVLVILFFHFHNIYRSFRFAPFHYEIRTIMAATMWLYIMLLFLAFGVGILDLLPRKATLAWMVLWPVVITLFRMVLRKGLRALRAKGHNLKRAVVAGRGETGERLIRHIQANAWSGITIKGYFLEPGNENDTPVDGITCLGGMIDLPEYLKTTRIDIIYITTNGNPGSDVRHLLRQLEDVPTAIHYVPDVFYIDMIVGGEVINFDNWPVIVLQDTPIRGIGSLVKRLLDIVISLQALIVLFPLMILIAAGIKRSSPGPVFYIQTRYGMHGQPIRIYKFRTMKHGKEEDAFTQATRNDERITRFGSFLRRTSLDELPQLINVVQGRMSLVGPRPHPVPMNREYQNRIARYRIRHRVRPGITGLAQVKGFRGETNTLEKIEKRIEYDIKYIREWSLFLDFEILARTLLIFLFQKTAY